MLNIVLFGPPGAGKGTQSNLLIDKYNLIHLSTGDLLREEITAGTKLGLEAKAIMDRGDLVSDDIVIGMIASKIDNNPDAIGFNYSDAYFVCDINEISQIISEINNDSL